MGSFPSILAGRKPLMKNTQKPAKSITAIKKKAEGFTAEERSAIKERAKELKADKADGESAVLAKIAETLVRHARVRQGRQGRLLFPTRPEVQDAVRDVRL